MALFFDGFDYYDSTALMLGVWNQNASLSSYNFSAVGDGIYSHGRYLAPNATGQANEARKSLGVNAGTMYVAFHYYFNVTSSNGNPYSLITFLDAGTIQCCLKIKLDGTKYVLELTQNANWGSTAIATSTVDITRLTWHWFAVKVVFHGSTGTIDVVMDGTSILSATGLDTIQTANAYAQEVGIGLGGHWNTGTRFDNFHCYDGSDGAPFNAVLSERRIYFALPNGDGADTDFTASAGSRYQCVDENPANTSDYVSSSTSGHRYSAVITDLPASVVPDAVKISGYIKKDDAGALTVKLYNKQSSTNYDGAAKTLGVDYAFHSETLLANPAGGAWDKTAVDASEWGVTIP